MFNVLRSVTGRMGGVVPGEETYLLKWNEFNQNLVNPAKSCFSSPSSIFSYFHSWVFLDLFLYHISYFLPFFMFRNADASNQLMLIGHLNGRDANLQRLLWRNPGLRQCPDSCPQGSIAVNTFFSHRHCQPLPSLKIISFLVGLHVITQQRKYQVVLGACSPFFRRVLKRNPHTHPLLYLKGIR